MAKTVKAKTKTTTAKKVTKKPAVAAKKAAPKKRAVSTATAKPQFFQIRITDQSLYWLIFGAVAILFAMWIYTLDGRVRDLYDQIDIDTYNTEVLDVQPEEQPTNATAPQAE